MTCPPLGTIAVVWTLRVYTGTAILTWGVVTFVYICGFNQELSKLLNNLEIVGKKMNAFVPKNLKYNEAGRYLIAKFAKGNNSIFIF